ncbi:MAG: hypothetical protein IPH72_13465 [Sandaracinaceae bacterium]|nr:hypothetical protein [Sandaracinaceae bacterium]
MTSINDSLDVLGDLPGAASILLGLRDVAAGRPTAEAALVQAASQRFARHDIVIPGSPEGMDAELVLYRRLGERMPPDADVYGRYGALLEELVSFLSALDQRGGR